MYLFQVSSQYSLAAIAPWPASSSFVPSLPFTLLKVGSLFFARQSSVFRLSFSLSLSLSLSFVSFSHLLLFHVSCACVVINEIKPGDHRTRPECNNNGHFYSFTKWPNTGREKSKREEKERLSRNNKNNTNNSKKTKKKKKCEAKYYWFVILPLLK